MKTKLLMIIIFGIILHPTLIVAYSQEQTFNEFMEWCEPQFAERCAELYEGGFVVNESNNNNSVFGILIVVILILFIGYYMIRVESDHIVSETMFEYYRIRNQYTFGYPN